MIPSVPTIVLLQFAVVHLTVISFTSPSEQPYSPCSTSIKGDLHFISTHSLSRTIMAAASVTQKRQNTANDTMEPAQLAIHKTCEAELKHVKQKSTAGSSAELSISNQTTQTDLHR